MINIVIPMAGQGSRFANAGYDKVKPFIEVLGKPMIINILENLSIPNARYILIARKEHLEKEPDLIKEIKENYPVEFIQIEKLTEGAACTVLYAHRLINNEDPLLIANCDQIIDINLQSFLNDAISKNLDGSILTFKDNDPKWSYAKLNNAGLVEYVKEKSVISDQATVGIYYFSKGRTFVESSLDMIVQNERINNEFYVCPVYNYSIKLGAKVGIYEINKNEMHGIGTPEDLNLYVKAMELK